MLETSSYFDSYDSVGGVDPSQSPHAPPQPQPTLLLLKARLCHLLRAALQAHKQHQQQQAVGGAGRRHGSSHGGQKKYDQLATHLKIIYCEALRGPVVFEPHRQGYAHMRRFAAMNEFPQSIFSQMLFSLPS